MIACRHTGIYSVCVYVCVFACVCVWNRGRERERESLWVPECIYFNSVSVCVCVWEREREKERGTRCLGAFTSTLCVCVWERERETLGASMHLLHLCVCVFDWLLCMFTWTILPLCVCMFACVCDVNSTFVTKKACATYQQEQPYHQKNNCTSLSFILLFDVSLIRFQYSSRPFVIVKVNLHLFLFSAAFTP